MKKNNIPKKRTRIEGPKNLHPKSLKAKFNHLTHGRPSTVNSYTDEKGTILSYVLRFSTAAGKKVFSQCAPDGVWGVKGIRKVLYRLPEVLSADTIYVVEGEKDVETLRQLQLTATCNPGGAGKWLKEYNQYFQNKSVIILPDNDDIGRKHAEKVVQSLNGTAKSIKIVFFPDLLEKGDITDWVSDGHTKKELLQIVENTPKWTPHEEATSTSDSKSPTIRIDLLNEDIPNLSAKAWEGLNSRNIPPIYYRHTTGIIRLQKNIRGELVLEPMDSSILAFELARATDWRNEKGKKVRTPSYIIKDMLADPKPPLPLLNRIIHTPIFSSNCNIILKPGYIENDFCYLVDNKKINRPPIKRVPKPKDTDNAVALLKEMIGDFPFVSDAEKANAIGLMILPFVREMISGPVPAYLIESPTPGTGKTLLASALSFPALGRHIESMSEGRSEEEYRKRITAKLNTSPTFVLIDNVGRKVDSSVLSSAITASIWQDRILGQTKMVTIPVHTAWIITGNNPVLSSEITRRTIRVRLDAKIDRPWTRDPSTFKHPNLLEWIKLNRGDIIWAILTMVKLWVVTGCLKPKKKKLLGGFEEWSRVMGGILMVNGITGFIGQPGRILRGF